MATNPDGRYGENRVIASWQGTVLRSPWLLLYFLCLRKFFAALSIMKHFYSRPTIPDY
jgi:hypothetical protein